MLLHNRCEMVKNHGLNMVGVEDTSAARHLAAKSQSAKLECLQFPCLPSEPGHSSVCREGGAEEKSGGDVHIPVAHL